MIQSLLLLIEWITIGFNEHFFSIANLLIFDDWILNGTDLQAANLRKTDRSSFEKSNHWWEAAIK